MTEPGYGHTTLNFTFSVVDTNCGIALNTPQQALPGSKSHRLAGRTTRPKEMSMDELEGPLLSEDADKHCPWTDDLTKTGLQNTNLLCIHNFALQNAINAHTKEHNVLCTFKDST